MSKLTIISSKDMVKILKDIELSVDEYEKLRKMI